MVHLSQIGLLYFFLGTATIAKTFAPPPYVHLKTVIHDQSFIPDAVLVFTVETISQPCVAAKATVLINGTTPGPEVRLQEGRTSWIRVYNNIANMNVTVVSFYRLN